MENKVKTGAVSSPSHGDTRNRRIETTYGPNVDIRCADGGVISIPLSSVTTTVVETYCGKCFEWVECRHLFSWILCPKCKTEWLQHSD